MKFATLAVVLLLNAGCGDTRNKAFNIEGVTLAVSDMDSMVTFYKEVFEVEFEPRKISGGTLYSGKWGNLELLLCPAEIAGNSAKQNRHQFEIAVNDVDEFLTKVKAYGGENMGEVAVDENGKKSIGIYDPDKNSILIKGD